MPLDSLSRTLDISEAFCELLMLLSLMDNGARKAIMVVFRFFFWLRLAAAHASALASVEDTGWPWHSAYLYSWLG